MDNAKVLLLDAPKNILDSVVDLIYIGELIEQHNSLSRKFIEIIKISIHSLY